MGLLAAVCGLSHSALGQPTVEPETAPQTAPAKPEGGEPDKEGALGVPPVKPASIADPGSVEGGKPAASGPVTNESAGSEHFVRAAEAIKQAKAISYELSYKGTGGMSQYSATLNAQVKMLRDPTMLGQTNGWIVRSTGSGKPRPDATAMEFDVAWMGTAVEFVSHTDKKVFEKRNPREAKNAAFSIGNSARISELYAGRPFAKELLASATYNVLEKETLHGVEVIPVEVTAGGKTGKTIWYFGVEDYLPRKYVSVIDNAMMSGTTEFEVRSLTLETTKPTRLTKADVRVAVPEGYTEDRPPKPVVPKAVPDGAGSDVKGEEKGGTATGMMIEMKGSVDGKSPPDFKVSEQQPLAVSKTSEVVAMSGMDETQGMESAVNAPQAEAVIQRAAPERPVVQQAPEFNLRSSAGGMLSLESLKGSYVILEFAGSWCVPTRESRLELDGLATQLKDHVKIVGLSVRDRSPAIAIDRFNKEPGHQFPLLVEADEVARAYGVTVFPTYFVLDPTHKVVKMLPGYTKDTTIGQIREVIQSAIGMPPPSLPVEPAGSTAPAVPVP
jgi:peroxiredoxin